MMWNSSDRSSWSDHHRSFTTFFYGASRLDWSERELNETTFSKMTLQCCWCFIDCVYSFNSVFVPRFTVDLSVQLSRGEEILLKFIVFASFHSFFFLKLLFFLHTLAAHLSHLKEKVCLKARVYLWFYCAYGLFQALAYAYFQAKIARELGGCHT